MIKGKGDAKEGMSFEFTLYLMEHPVSIVNTSQYFPTPIL